jgi:hypothetical protein
VKHPQKENEIKKVNTKEYPYPYRYGKKPRPIHDL